MQGSLHCTLDGETVQCFGRDDVRGGVKSNGMTCRRVKSDGAMCGSSVVLFQGQVGGGGGLGDGGGPGLVELLEFRFGGGGG